MRRTRTLVPLAAATFSLLGTALAPAAHAADPATSEDVVGGLVSPLSLAVGPDGTVYAAQNFAGMLSKVSPGAEPEVVYADEAQREAGAVSVSDGVVTFATTATGKTPEALLWTLGEDGTPAQVADLWRYERKHNPDAGRTYGIKHVPKSCRSRIDKHLAQGLLGYHGIKESHPYATTSAGGTTYVADAAANAVLAVDEDGISTVAALPATKITVTKKIRKAFELPRCLQGKAFRAEAVPTDVEVGPDGNLYVTSLPGGPDDPAMGANGRVYRVEPGSGEVTKVADGILSPVGLAIGPDGTAYVSSLFGGTIYRQELGGQPEELAQVAFPGDVEYADGYLYATETDLMNDGSTPPAGKVVRFATGGQQ